MSHSSLVRQYIIYIYIYNLGVRCCDEYISFGRSEKNNTFVKTLKKSHNNIMKLKTKRVYLTVIKMHWVPIISNVGRRSLVQKKFNTNNYTITLLLH